MSHFTRSFSLAVVLSILAPSADAQMQLIPAQPGVAPPKVLDYVEAVPRAPNGMLTFQGLQMLGLDFQVALDMANFEKLERMHNDLRDGRARSYDGTWLLESVQIGADAWARAGGSAEKLERLSKDWAVKVPDSPARANVVAMLWVKLAWKARGGTTASGVSPEGFKLFDKYLERAAESLGSSTAASQSSPIWHLVAMQLAGSGGLPPAEQAAIAAAAMEKFPAYYMLHQTRVNYLLPQWGGSFEAVAKAVNHAVKVTHAEEGTANYALLYHFASKRLHWEEFTASGWKWAPMKVALEDLVKRHPDAYNWALYGYWACRSRDREATARVFQAMGPGAQVSGFHSSITTEGCRAFALGT